MTEINDGETVDVRLPGGVATIDAGPPVMGPPGMRGQTGPRGDPGGTTTIVFSFREREPDELPEDGLIPSGWDDVRRPETAIQLAIGQSVENERDGYLWLFVGPSAIPGGWIETGQMRGPPGDRGPIGDTGPVGPPGERGLQGPTGTPGAKGDRGDPGPQGARGEIGPTGAAGATGPRGEVGERGDPGEPGRDGTDGVDGEPGPQGEQGEVGQPGAPSFIVGSLATRTAAELAAIAPTGLIPANFDGAGRPPVPYQMGIGEAMMAIAPSEQPFLVGQAITWCGLGTATNGWIAVVVKGDRGEQGDQGERGEVGPIGGQGPAGADGQRGSLWHWSPFAPPTGDAIGPHQPGDMVLCLIPGGTAATPGHGDVYHVTAGGAFNRDGSILGPRGDVGPQGPPGEVSQAQFDGLSLRVTRLETIVAQTLSSDVVLAENADTVIQSIPLGVGDHVAQGTFTFELDRGADPSATSRLVTMWVDPSGPVVLTGNRSGQLYLHQALPIGSLSFGPMRALVSGPGNAVVYYRVSQPPGDSGPQTGLVRAKATTVIGAHPGASGFVSR